MRPNPRSSLLLLVTLLVAHSCAHRSEGPAWRQSILDDLQGQELALRQSVFTGPLYDENELTLLSPHEAGNLHDLVDPRGRPIQPELSQEILPAGTRIRVVDLALPPRAGWTKRMLLTPRFQPWLLVEVAENAAVLAHGTKGVLVLKESPDADAIRRQIQELLGAVTEVDAWMAARAPTKRVAIRHKEWVEEMSPEELKAAIGAPFAWIGDTRGEDDTEAAVDVAWYPTREYWFSEQSLTEVRPARPMEKAAP